MKVQKLNEALDFTDATRPGRGACCPTAIDMMKMIEEGLKYMNDPEYSKPARNQLKHCAKVLCDNKQSFENFNAYWEERFPAMISYLDEQLELIPREIIAGMTEALSDKIRKGELDHTGHDDWTDVYSAEEDGVKVQFQDTVGNSFQARTKKDRWGNSYIDGIYDKHPKEFTSTWGRVWDNGEFKKGIRGPKYQVRAEMAKYLDSKK